MLSTRIIPDKSGNRYLCGETISGKVEVIVYDECKDRKLVFALGSKGVASAPQQQITYFIDTEQKIIFTGDWKPGTYEYSFSITAPDGYSYAGTIMTVGWYLRSGVIGSGETIIRHTKQDSDLEGEDRRDIQLAPGEPTRNDLNRKKESQVVRREAGSSIPGCLLSSFFLFLVGLMAAWWGWEKDLYLPGLVMALIGGALVGVTIWQALISRKIAMLELRVGSTMIWPGEKIPCTIFLKAKRPFEIEQATITLEGWEHVKRFTGIYNTTGPVNKHVIYKNTQEMQLPLKRLTAGASIELTGECMVPVGAAGTMEFDNEVKNYRKP